MNTATVSNGRLILIGAIALIVIPYAWIVASLDLGVYSVPAVFIAKGVSLGLIALLAFALVRFRWLQFSIGVISTIAGLFGVLGCVGSLGLTLQGEFAFLAGRSIVGLIAFTLSSLFVAWALLLSRAVRDYGKRAEPAATAQRGQPSVFE